MPLNHRPNAVNAVWAALFAALVVLLAAKSVLTLDLTWDTLAYQLPFAARKAGMLPVESFVFTDWLEQCYRGFPSLPSYLYGRLWRFTGSANAANLVSVFAFAGYVLILARLAGAPAIVAAVAIGAIPVIHVNLGSVYTDLVANVGFAGALVLATMILIEPAPPIAPRLAGIAASAALAANFKLMFVPLSIALVILAIAVMSIGRFADRKLISAARDELRHAPGWAVLLIAGVAAMLAPAIVNFADTGNPIYPIRVGVGAWTLFPGVSGGDLYREPAYLAGAPGAVRWLLSVSEFLALGQRPIPYTIGQGNAPADAQSLRMGGFLAFYVIVNLAYFAYRAWTSAGPHRVVLALFAAMTVAVALLPASHELRYYSFWMVYLVSVNLLYAWRWAGSADDRRHLTTIAVGAFLFVAATTGFRYLTPWPPFSSPPVRSIHDLVVQFNLKDGYAPQLADGGRYCLVNWQPYAFLGSRLFHSDRDFVARTSTGGDCPDGWQTIDFATIPQRKPAA